MSEERRKVVREAAERGELPAGWTRGTATPRVCTAGTRHTWHWQVIPAVEEVRVGVRKVLVCQDCALTRLTVSRSRLEVWWAEGIEYRAWHLWITGVEGVVVH